MRAGLALLVLAGCATPSPVLEPDVLSGTIVESARGEIVVASDWADSATTRVRGIDGVVLGLRSGDRVRVRRRDASIGKADPLDWDCRALHACDLATGP